MTDPVRVEGLRELQRGLKRISTEYPKALRRALNDAAELVVDTARPQIPSRTGAARRSLKPASTQTTSRVRAGGGRVPYYPWLDFGGSVGKRKSVRRPFIKSGRYIYPAYYKLRDSGRFEQVLSDAVLGLVRDVGLEVD